MELTDDLLALLRGRSTCYIATVMPDGSPQLTQTWVDTDGRHVLVNTVEGFQKVRNVTRDPRVALTVADPAQPHRYTSIRGRVIQMTREGADDQLEALSQRYLGGPYPGFGAPAGARVILVIEVERLHAMG